MDLKLAENIRAFRKARSLTQEQLAEALGVTVGAVYKWEAKLSQPELALIVEMADFSDTSLDVLLGYEMRDNHMGAAVRRLKECRARRDRTGLAEAEKALKKYPNSFDIVYVGAHLYLVFGVEEKEPALDGTSGAGTAAAAAEHRPEDQRKHALRRDGGDPDCA